MSRLCILALVLLAFTMPRLNSQSAPSKTQPPASTKAQPGHPDPALNLAMGQWRFVTIGTTQVVTMGRQQPYLKFDTATHSVTGFTGCNRLRGTYQAKESSLAFEKVASTRTACIKDTYEPQVLEVLNSATGYKIVDHELRVLGPKGTLAVLTRPHEEQTTEKKPSDH